MKFYNILLKCCLNPVKYAYNLVHCGWLQDVIENVKSQRWGGI